MAYADPVKQRAAQRAYAQRQRDANGGCTPTQARRVAWLNEQKSKPCADCGVQYPPYVMQFDHVRGVKVGSLGVLRRTVGMARLVIEIAKCEVVCANCHAERTWRRSKAD